VIQDTFDLAVQAQPVVVVTATLLLEVPAPTFTVVGETEKVHAAAAWVTVTVRPATVNVPVRCDEPVLAATVNVTVPLPVPLLPAVTVIHEAFDAALHVHPEVALTFTLFVEVPAATLIVLLGETLYVQAVPSCVMVYV
jgi:hypothetical protein